MNKRVEKIIILNAIVLFSVIAFVILTDIAIKHNFGECLLLKIFHIYCPGCGGTRSLRALLRFDIVSSFRLNAILPLGVALYIYYNLRYIIALIKKDETYFDKETYRLIKYYAFFVLAYFIVRNILLLAFKIDLIGEIIS